MDHFTAPLESTDPEIFARALAGTLLDRGTRVPTGGTDAPLVVVDLRPLSLTGAG